MILFRFDPWGDIAVLIWQEVQIFHHIDDILLELVDLLSVTEDVMAQELDLGIRYLVLEWIDQGPHGVLQGNTTLFLAQRTENDHSFGEMLLQMLQNRARPLDQPVVKDLSLLPGL